MLFAVFFPSLGVMDSSASLTPLWADPGADATGASAVAPGGAPAATFDHAPHHAGLSGNWSSGQALDKLNFKWVIPVFFGVVVSSAISQYPLIGPLFWLFQQLVQSHLHFGKHLLANHHTYHQGFP